MAFSGKVALVTGGASGMGQLSALRLAEQGAQVAIVDMNDDNLAATAAKSPNIHPFKCDVSDWQQVKEVVAKVEEQLGPIDRLTHCAAIMPTGRILDQPADVINRVMTINYTGTVHLTKAVLPLMRERGTGQIILYGSIAGYVLAPEMGAYNASKAATNAYAEVLIHENRGSGVQLMAVHPPMVKTPLINQALETRNIRESLEKDRMAAPEFIVDEVEKGMDKGVEILYPGVEAKMLTWLRRFSPALLWKIIDASMK